MLYEWLQPLLAKNEYRTFNVSTDSSPSEGNKFNYRLARPYISNKIVLDVGCWSGLFERLAIHATKKLVAIDPNGEAIAYAKRTIQGPQFRVGSATALPFRKESFDVVT